ncbi:MAG: HAD hydrolase-like protein [Thermoplasmata archaeon]|nr:HAD hydrolase-like protein [Thermoplasmata archaeon]
MPSKRRPAPTPPAPRTEPSTEELPPDEVPLPMIGGATSQFAEVAHLVTAEPVVSPQQVARGVVVFDLDGTIIDDIGLISHVAADVISTAFGTPAAEARIHYLATTGMPFEAQLAQLFPAAPAVLRAQTARTFHQRKIQEAYKHAKPFPEIPRVLRTLSQQQWTLVVSTGAEREMADLVLEREGLRYWFESVLGSGQGTKREHLIEYRRRYPEAPMVLVGDSRFDMEAAASAPDVLPVGRASSLQDWTLTPADLKSWGAVWADYSLGALPEAIETLLRLRPEGKRPAAPRKSARPGKK